MFDKKIAAMIIAVVIMIIAPLSTANAGSVSARLTTDIKTVSTAYLGNTTGKYQLVGSVSSTSEYSVEYILYVAKNGDSDMTVKARFQYSSMEAFKNYYDVNKDVYTVAKCTMYGNKESNPKSGNYAVVTLSNY